MATIHFSIGIQLFKFLKINYFLINSQMIMFTFPEAKRKYCDCPKNPILGPPDLQISGFAEEMSACLYVSKHIAADYLISVKFDM